MPEWAMSVLDHDLARDIAPSHLDHRDVTAMFQLPLAFRDKRRHMARKTQGTRARALFGQPARAKSLAPAD